MREVRIAKFKLLEIITQNRDEHRQIFLDAQKVYREKAIELLDSELKHAREGENFVLKRITSLVAPVDHTADYDRAIAMLKLSVDETITLSTADFANLVEDKWEWSRRWAMSNSAYTSSPKFRSLLEEDEY